MIEQKRDKKRTINRKRGDHERPHILLIPLVDIGAFLEQDLGDVLKAFLDRFRKGSGAVESRPVGISALSKKKNRRFLVVFPGRR